MTSTTNANTSQTENIESLESNDSEYEEFYIHIELSELEDSDFLSTCKTYSLIGLDTSTPILKLDNQIFQGRYEESVGTNVYFEETIENGDLQQQNSEDDKSKLSLKYRCHTTKKIKIRFQRIFLEPLHNT